MIEAFSAGYTFSHIVVDPPTPEDADSSYGVPQISPLKHNECHSNLVRSRLVSWSIQLEGSPEKAKERSIYRKMKGKHISKDERLCGKDLAIFPSSITGWHRNGTSCREIMVVAVQQRGGSRVAACCLESLGYPVVRGSDSELGHYSYSAYIHDIPYSMGSQGATSSFPTIL